MTDTPPSANPTHYATQARKHWADPQEIKPGIFSVMEGAGRKASTRDFAIVRYNGHDWHVLGRVRRPRYGYVDMSIAIGLRDWKARGPAEFAPDMIEQMIALAKEHG